MPWKTFGLAVLAGVMLMEAFGGVWIGVADLVHIPPGVQPSLKGISLPTGIALLIMSSLAAPLSEEAAFRGYAMGILEKAWGWAPAAIVAAAILFAAVHVVQGLDATKLGLYFGAGLLFATVAWMTNSLYAAMAVHSLGDVLGFTVREVARRYRVGEDKIRRWIARGELRTINTAAALCGKPRWVIPVEALEEFDRRRSASAPAKPSPRRRKRTATLHFYP